MKLNQLQSMLRDCMNMELEEARTMGSHGYICRCLVIATMPHSKPENNEFERTSGAFTLNMIAPSHIGLPYGRVPRLLMMHICREAVIKKSPCIVLGGISEFVRKLELDVSGRVIRSMRDQIRKLFSTTISYRENFTVENHRIERNGRFLIATKDTYFWCQNSTNNDQSWGGEITLSKEFYDEIIQRPVSIDLRAIRALKNSSMALDIYCWLTFRMSHLNKITHIPWEYLMLQFGADYHYAKNFKVKFLHFLKKVLFFYSKAQVNYDEQGLILFPSPTHIPKTNNY
jgi:Plasmid encoded RepA protein